MRVTLTVTTSVTLPTLVAGMPDTVGAFCGPHVTAGEVIMVPRSVAVWLRARGKAQ